MNTIRITVGDTFVETSSPALAKQAIDFITTMFPDAVVVAEPVAASPIAKASQAPTSAPKPRRGGPSGSRLSRAAKELTDERILAVVREQQPIAPGALALACGLPNNNGFALRLQPLVKAGLLAVTGATTTRRVSLGPKAPAAQPKRSSTPVVVPAPATATDAVVAARDAAILARLVKGDTTFEQLCEAVTRDAGHDDQAHRDAVRRALRRLIVRGQIADIGTKFRRVAA